ncbi:MAG: Maf family protein, partial [Planctomycetota bacterium]|nr:Maf family protein [Planctomycetota bacterium]
MSAPASPVPLVLASASERRRKILTDAGYAYDLFDPGEVEQAVAAAPTPEALAVAKARAKAQAAAAALAPARPTVVIGADTLAELDGEVLGKPLDRTDAVRILTRLSGTKHRVITGLCLWLAPGNPQPE